MIAEIKQAGYDEELIAAREKKKAGSIILTKGEREWNEVGSMMPDPNVPVIIRFENRNMIFAEDENDIIYAEDESVAKILSGSDGETKWSIVPPYLKYNYSPLVDKDRLTEDTVVTHWAPISPEELDAWEHRFDILGDYSKFSIQVSADYEELVYRSLLNGANLIARSCGGYLDAEGNELQAAMYAVLSDLQSCIDRNVHVTRGKEVKNVVPRIEDIPESAWVYRYLQDKFHGDMDKVSRVIRTLEIIDDDPSLLTEQKDEDNDAE